VDSPFLKKPNRLLSQKSPYLLQHAYNPVEWYPWGDEAFEKARLENKPVLVSIGYSTCHWCHVMEKETFEDPVIGELMNKTLVCIKVDREERPDVDKIYMTAATAMTGSGGWPLNVFLTPDRKPFYAGTYFPPTRRWGQPAWREVIEQIAETWNNPVERVQIDNAGQQMADALQNYVGGSSSGALAPDAAWMDHAFHELDSAFDMTRGGFSPAPKFPMPTYHHFLLRYYARTRGDADRDQQGRRALQLVQTTLREMVRGGIYDQLGGGFSRYSTDVYWHVPHFEKMLYDNAQLLVNLLETIQAEKDAELERASRETLAYIHRDMTHPEGAYYSAEDADSLPAPDATEKREGAFYTWEHTELLERLDREAFDLFTFQYGVQAKGNVRQDPHGEFQNQNVLYLAHPLAETARHFQKTPEDAAQILFRAQRILMEARQKRPRPHLDDKIIAAWNGLMISAEAKAFQVLGDADALARGEKAAGFLQKYLWDKNRRLLSRSWREGQSSGPGIADDYAFVAQGLLDLYEAGGNKEWLRWAQELTDVLLNRFYDSHRGGFYMTAADQDKHLLLRVKEEQDNVEPAAGSVAALVLMRLSLLVDRPDWEDPARRTIASFGSIMRDTPRGAPYMLAALDFQLSEPLQFTFYGKGADPLLSNLFRALQSTFLPVKTIRWHAEGDQTEVVSCRGRSCQLPIRTVPAFQAMLEKFKNKSE